MKIEKSARRVFEAEEIGFEELFEKYMEARLTSITFG